jgi:asparagine synthase (glutamine-hydrolysing)
VSGIVVALRSDDGPIERRVIEHLTAPLTVCGPDAQQTWCDGSVGLGYARLRVGTRIDAQPLTLDGEAWIVADARIDDRHTLAAALGIRHDTTRSDAEMILHAYAKWGEACVNCLIGDFAFAIWDRRARRLFCARDHLGVRPLYYVDTRCWLLVSSSVMSLRAHPAVSDALNDSGVADFLLFGHNADPSSTTFRDIRQLKAAHTLNWSADEGCRVRRYWQLPTEEPRYQTDEECAAECRELLDTAIADRVRGERVAVMFSGGVDSVTVAARARRYCASHGDNGVRAFSFTHESMLPDCERRYAADAAAHLRITCDFYEAGNGEGWAFLGSRFTPEPLVQLLDSSALVDCLDDIAAHSRVVLSGEGPDNALVYEWRSYIDYLCRRRAFGRLASDALSFLRHHRRLPLWSTMTRSNAASEADGRSPIPPWMSPDLVKRLQLEDRWCDVMRPADSRHPVRPVAWFSLQIPLWQTMHNEWDPCYTGVALEFCYPFLDVRVLRFLLRVPVIPWCRGKHLLRYAFRENLPSAVRLRPKTPLPESIEVARIRRDGVPPIALSHRLEAYASLDANRSVIVDDARSAEGAVRLATFSQWLAHLDAQSAAAVLD